ncbi:TetR/AcrR family transcriptional regulator [Streptosporangium saharense]|uniref:TetR/AcrR family transcriptional regulator n=1 Tax=Streptosporangium saharense TaxID=1706840 RepID=UPI003692A727
MANRHGARNTEELIYRAAVGLMAARGYHGTTLRDVARAVSLQMSSIYYYFPSKQELLLAVMRRTTRDLRAAVEPPISAAGSVRERLGAGIRAHVLFHADRRLETLVTDSEIRALEGEGREEITALRDAYGDLFREVLETGLQEGVFSFEDSHVATNALMTMCAGVAVWYRPDGHTSLSRIADQFTHLYLDGVTASPTRKA